MTSAVEVHEEHEPALWPPFLALLTGLIGFGIYFVGMGNLIVGFGMIALFVIAVIAFAIHETSPAQVKKLRTIEEAKPEHIKNPPFSKYLFMWIFLGTEVIFFTILITVSLVIRYRSEGWNPHETLNIGITAFNTFVLICSSYTMARAVHAIEHGDVGGLKKWLLATFAGGSVFIGIQVYEYIQLIKEGFYPGNPEFGGRTAEALFATTFYTQTGFHGAHVSAGLFVMALLIIKAFRGGFTKENHDGVVQFGLYWHFVDLVWIILFTVVYLF